MKRTRYGLFPKYGSSKDTAELCDHTPFYSTPEHGSS
jgi:hypothetical protein